ncbi:MAG TPA: hypothetical protein VIL20_16495, partial [Sandaracinaceae bacterium]
MGATDPRVPLEARPHADQEPIYEGPAGQTRLRSLHVPLPSGFVRTVQVYDVVNTATHPELREPALTGTLHRFETGEALAVPFVFHDPHARKLALVVPEPMRHEELRLRAELLAEIAKDTQYAVPGYVRDAPSVIGPAGLAAYLERSSAAGSELARKEKELAEREAALQKRHGELEAASAALAEREAALQKRHGELEAASAALSQREARLQARAEEVTRREDELRGFLEQIEAAQADLALREQELEARLEALAEREAELALRAEARPIVREDEVEELDDEEVDELEPLATSPGELPPDDLGAAVQLVDEPPAPAVPLGASVLGGMADPISDVEDDLADEVEELDDVEPIGDVTGVHAELVREDTDLRPRPHGGEPEPSQPPPSVAPPPAFFERRHGAPATAVVEDGAVRLFVRLPEGKDELVDAERPPELLAQLVVVEGYPVCLLTIVDERDGRPQALRAPLDPRSTEDRRILEALRRRFAAELVVFSATGRYLRRLEVSSPREVNVARILERVARAHAAAIDANTAIERVLASPPPVRAADHPFTGEEPAGDARAAQAALDRLIQWSSADKLDHALLVLSIPRDRVDATTRRVLADAVEHGLALPKGMAERAVSLGVAPDVATLVGRQIAALVETTKTSALPKERIADNWERLLEAATEAEVALDGDVHELAWRAIRDVKGGDGAADVEPSKLPQMGPPELVMLLEHPRHRKDAALELCRRKDPAFAETLCKAVRKMPRAEVVRVVPRIAELG